ncbi:restriction endonuclease subunit S [Pseudomonas putida]|uniref:restriction endonuclease subunit S n=1 Tax=Pseudomonas putida TaxID=303 RepID=UPI00226452F2|nr:restriction endonuclease subunit S [Pseudomonas putida]
MNELPSNWADCLLEDLLGQLENGKALQQGWSPQCDSVPAAEGEWGVLKTTAIQDGYFLETENKSLPSSLSPKPELEVKAGDLLMTCAGPRSRCGVICHVEKTRKKLIFSGKIYRFRPNESFVTTKFLTHLLRTPELKEKIDEIKTGISESGMNMTRDRFFSLPVRLAPFNEQTRIAAKLDVLLAQAHTLKGRIDGIPMLLDRLRQSVLAAAVSGRLTDEWRNGAMAKWETCTLADVIDGKPRNGYSPKSVEYETSTKTLSLSATTSGVFKGEHFKFIDETISRDSHLWLRPGDILIQRANTIEYVGVSAIYDDKPMSYIYPDLMMKCRAREGVLTEYLHICLSSRAVRKHFRDNATGTAGNMPKINQKTVMSAPVLLAPLSEQTEIVRRVEKLFAFADQLETRVKVAQARINHLTQSILAKAFRGELVPQDPNDEPASVLLERIKAQRAAAPKAKRGRQAANPN